MAIGEQIQIAILVLLVIILIFVTYVFSSMLVKQSSKKTSGTEYKVVIHFATSKIKLTLNPEQFEQLNAILNLKEGMFQIGDELDQITVYREAICWVQVKQK